MNFIQGAAGSAVAGVQSVNQIPDLESLIGQIRDRLDSLQDYRVRIDNSLNKISQREDPKEACSSTPTPSPNSVVEQLQMIIGRLSYENGQLYKITTHFDTLV